MTFLGYGRQLIEEDDIEAVAAALRGDYLTTGPLVDAFEKALAEATGAREAVVCANGTAALHLAAMAAGIGPGDLCIVPAISFAATANCVRFVGGDVLFSDVDPDTGLMRLSDLEAAAARATRPVKAILPVHLAGQTGDIAAIGRWAKERNVEVIEDACHAIGGALTNADGKEAPIGAGAIDGALSTFSFHPVKTITMGEGGAVTTQSSETAARMRLLRNHGITRSSFIDEPAAHDADGSVNPWYMEMVALGYNYRATDFQCALGLSQLKKLDRFVSRRAELRARYVERLKALAPHVSPMPVRPGCRPAWHLMVALVDFDALATTRGALIRALAARGVGTQVHYIPIPRHPYYRNLVGDIDLPGADRYYRRTLSLPLQPAMSVADVDRVVDILAECISVA